MKLLIVTASFIFLQSCQKVEITDSESRPVSHHVFDSLLSIHVDEIGLVDYKGWIQDSVRLNTYLSLLSENAPNTQYWSDDQIKAYWINVYNAFTIKLIVDHYPVEGIKDIVVGPSVPFMHSPWDIKFINIADQALDLNTVEHNILRKHWDDPRIHFAINCASMSCPRLRNEAYVGEKLNDQLDDQTIIFFNDSTRNEISPKELQLNRILNWYRSDFTREMKLEEFVQQYVEIGIDNNPDIVFKSYDWGLNNQ